MGDEPRVSHVLVVRAGKTRYALPVREVIEVMDDVSITPVPGMATSVRGVVRYERGVVAVVPLSYIVSAGSTDEGRSPTVVVVRSNEVPVAIEVDDALDVIEVPVHISEIRNEWWSIGSMQYGDGQIDIVDVGAVASQLEEQGAVQ